MNDRLGDYLDGEISSAARRTVDRHLESCPDCSTELDELRATLALLRHLPEPPAPSELVAAVMEGVGEQEARRGSIARWLDSLLRSPLPVPVATAVAGLMVIGMLGSLEPTSVLSFPSLLSPGAAALSPGEKLAASVPEAASNPRSAVARARDEAGGVAAPSRASAAGVGEVRSPVASEREVAAFVAAAKPRVVPRSVASVPVQRTAAHSARSSTREREDPRPLLLRGARPSPVAPRPELALCQQYGSGSPGMQEGAEFLCRPWLSGMLALAQYDPRGFSHELAGFSQPDREGWIDELVRFATRNGSVNEVARGLRGSRDPDLAELAERFKPRPPAVATSD